MAPQPDAKHLLELLKRAADELKASQREADELRAELKSTQDKLVATELSVLEERRQKDRLSKQLEDVGTTTLKPGALRLDQVPRTVPGLPSPVTGPMPSLDERPREEKTSVGGDEQQAMLGLRLAGMEAELATLENDRRDLRARIKSLEAELEQPRESPEAARLQGELEHELANTRQQLIVEQARGADLMHRLQAWETRSQELEQSLAAVTGNAEQEHAQLDQLAGQLSQVETELTTERARTQAMEEQLKGFEQGASDEQKRLLEATSRVAQLEVEVSGLKGRRDELNVEIGKVENERNAARARAQELEHAAAQVREALTAEHAAALEAERLKRVELEQQLSREKEKHQITAQKLLEARGKGRDTDEQLQKATQQNAELFSQLDALTRGHAEAVEVLQREHAVAVETLQREHTAASAGLTEQVAALTTQLETATTEWRHTDRQYEQLHKEMLVILDQRDEARRELETIRQRFGLR